MISPIPSSVALRISPVTRIMPAKVIMLMHANGERDGEEPEKWRSSYTRGRKDKSIRGRFEYIYIYILLFFFHFISLLLFFCSFVFFFHHFESSSHSRWGFQPRYNNAFRINYFSRYFREAMDRSRLSIKRKKSSPLHFVSLCHPPFSSSFPPPFFNAF